MTQQAQQAPDMFADRRRQERERAARVGNNGMFVEVVDSSDADTPFTRRNQYRRGPETADGDLRNDNIVSALREGTAEVKNSDGVHVGWENNRLDLLLDQETRRLLDTLPYAPSREETLANIIRRECRNLTEEQQYALACMDRNIDRDAIRPMLMESAYKKRTVEQDIPGVSANTPTAPAPTPVHNIENDVKRVIASTVQPVQQAPVPSPVTMSPVVQPQPVKMASEPVQPLMPTPALQPNPCPLPTGPAPMMQPNPCPLPTGPMPQQQPVPMPSQPTLNIPFSQAAPQPAPMAQERTVSLTCPIGRYNIPVLDIIQEAQYIVIVQREDAYLLVTLDPNHVTYRIDVVPRDLEYSGISFRHNGRVFTIMIMK